MFPLWDYAPHTCSVYSCASGRDEGAGVTLTYTLAQSDVPCSINSASASEQERFAQVNQVVTHTVGFKSSVLTVTLTPGMKLVGQDGESLHIKGINTGFSWGPVPALTYCYCESLLI